MVAYRAPQGNDQTSIPDRNLERYHAVAKIKRGRTRIMTAKARCVRLHIQNLPASEKCAEDDVPDRSANIAFRVTEERFRAASERHPDLAAILDATISDDLADLPAAAAEAEVVFSKTKVLRERFPVPTAPNLKWVFVTSAGVETLLPTDWLPPGAVLVNCRGTHAEKAGEFALTAILMLNARIPFFVTRQRAARWDPVFSTTARGKTVAVIGTGVMGRATAERVRQAGLKVIGVNASGRPHDAVDEIFTSADLDTVLARADFVVVNVPAIPATRGLIGRRQLDMMKPTAGLVNMARADVVDQAALADKLTRGELAGAVLDVFDVEPLPRDSPLWSTPNLIITPHVSCDDADAYIPRALDIFFENLACYLAGRPMPNQIDPARGY